LVRNQVPPVNAGSALTIESGGQPANALLHQPGKVTRALFRSHLDQAGIDDIRLALNQNQPLGNERFLGRIEKMTGVRREARPRGRPRLEEVAPSAALPGQGELSLKQSNQAPLAAALPGQGELSLK
jgi:hypothetical protein